MDKRAFFVGIKGVGMTSLALAMQDAGWVIAGSDSEESFITDEILSRRQIIVHTPVDSPIPQDIDLVVYSGAFTKPEHRARVIPLAEALAEFVKKRKVIAVAGVGGKTTTTAMLAVLFHSLGRDIGYYVGTGSVAGLAAPGHYGTDPLYVVEADEYAVSKTDRRAKMNLLSPSVVITTNIVHDHPDLYQSETDTLKVFRELLKKLPSKGTWIYRDDDPLTKKLIVEHKPKCKLIPYNLSLPRLDLSVFGEQNQLDAQAAVMAAQTVGLSQIDALRGIKSYRGAGRRQEFHGQVAGRLLYDDYGHHPHEVEVTICSFRKHFPGRRIILVFESHTYTRTETLLAQFAKSCSLADKTFIMPIFESAREKGQNHHVTPETFAALIPGAQAVTWEHAAKTIWRFSSKGDIILTMGAGFVYKLHDKFRQFGK